MVVNLSPERQAELLAEYHRKKQEREATDAKLKAERTAQQTYIKAQVEATRLNEIHTATKDYVCQNCGIKIPKGTRYRRGKVPVGFGWAEGTHYAERVTHLVCVELRSDPTK